MTKNHNVACAIRAYRETRGYSQEYMADMLDICQSAYANLESGKTSLSIDRLMKISIVLDCDIHELIDSAFKEKPDHPIDIKPALRIHGETKDVYDALIAELKDEVIFLRALIREKEHH